EYQGGQPITDMAAFMRSRYLEEYGGDVEVGDYDSDGDLDIYFVNCARKYEKQAANVLYQNDGKGHFTNVTGRAGVGNDGHGMHAIFGDYDNDGHTDLYVVNVGPNVLYHNKGDGTFEDVSQKARANEPQTGRKAVFLDYDHDNDLDIFIANDIDFPTKEGFDEAAEIPPSPSSSILFNGPVLTPQSNTLLRNNGNGTFTDQTDEAGLLVDRTGTHDAVIADFDGDNDIDLFTADAGRSAGDFDAGKSVEESESLSALGPLSKLFVNERMGKMKVGGQFTPALEMQAPCAVEGDFNHDGKPDLIAAQWSWPFLYTNKGDLRFDGERITKPWDRTVQGLGQIQVFDYNNDGWSDLLFASARHGYAGTLGLSAGTGPGMFTGVTEAVGLEGEFGWFAALATGDLDGDGDLDIVLSTRDRGPIILKNETETPANWIDVRLVGKKVNRSGIGSTVEIASGGHYQKQTAMTNMVHFGLGDLKTVDVVRVTWPNGQAQNVIRPEINKTLTIDEYVKVSASCAFLYTFNGNGFELVNEILGIGPMGVPMAPGVYFPLDNTELTKIESNQLVAKDGVYEIRLTEELREITYADQITLRVVDHPAALEVIPNEMFSHPAPEDKLFAVGDHRPPVSAVDHRGENILPLLYRRDGKFPTFPLVELYDGLAEPHSLTLDLGDLSGEENIMLFLDSWVYWPDSSVSMAIAQDPRYEITPLTLEVRDEQGRWQTAIESVGLPTSKGLVVPVDLTGKFICDDYRVRLSTNMRVYFDRIFVSTHDRAKRCRVTELPVKDADLHYRGFSRMSRDRFGFERFDYADAKPLGAWNPPKGYFTRFGDVTPLLATPDNMFVIFGPGDELTMRFDAAGLPEVPAGWTRDFIFYANGWVKDGDLNTKFSETVGPLPFHGMSGYPYRDSEAYPDTPELRQYIREYQTRPTRPTVGLLSSGHVNLSHFASAER
ncbi:MAG: CRTAC1 family protein, partial [Phycisphaerales bacterium]